MHGATSRTRSLTTVLFALAVWSLSSADLASAVTGRTTGSFTDDVATTRPADAGRSEIENRPIGKRPRRSRRAELTAGTTSSSSWWGQSVLALGAVLALIAGGTWAVKKYMPAAVGGNMGQSLEIIGRHHLSPKQSLYLVRVGKRAVLIGASPTEMSPLLEIRDAQEVHTMLPRPGRREFNGLLDEEVRQLASDDNGREKKAHGTRPSERPEPPAPDPDQTTRSADQRPESPAPAPTRDRKAQMTEAIDRFRAYARRRPQSGQ